MGAAAPTSGSPISFARCSHARACGLARGDECEFPLTQHDIACVTGLTSVHVNRTLQQMRKEGLIELHGRRLTLLEPNGLGKAAIFDSGYLRLAEGGGEKPGVWWVSA